MSVDQSAKIRNQSLAQKSKLEVKYRAFYLSLDVIKFLEKILRKDSIKIISDQLIRCVTSIGANIVEAKASASKREFLYYFQISLKSTNEVKYWLALLKELLPSEKEIITKFSTEAEEIGRIIGSSVLTMKGKRL